MSTSAIIFLSAVACGVLFAACSVYEQRHRMPWHEVRLKTPFWLLIGCTVLGGGAYLLDSDLAGQTLYEVVADGPGEAVPSTSRYPFVVEHPAATHDLLVAPDSSQRVTAPIRVQVRLTGPDGREVFDDQRTLDVRCPSDEPCEWDTVGQEFVPGAPGPYELAVTVLQPGVTSLHIRVGDAAKTDGERAPGF